MTVSKSGSGSKPSTVEVCIVAYGSADVISSAMTSASTIPHVRIAVCDNHPSSTSVDVAATAAERVGVSLRTVLAPHNPGFAAGCNLLAESSTADWLVFLNPDAVITAWPWDAKGPPTGTLIGANQQTSGGRPLQAYGTTYGVSDELRRSWLRRAAPHPNGFGFVGGGALAVERTLFVALGGFDPGYFLFYEDIDLCMRAANAGMRVEMEPSWTVVHDLGHSARKDMTAALLASYRSGRRFHSTYGHNLRAYDFYMLLDSALRWVLHLARPSAGDRRAYWRVLQTAAGRLAAGSKPDHAEALPPNGSPEAVSVTLAPQ